jgi:hypothetical protein
VLLGATSFKKSFVNKQNFMGKNVALRCISLSIFIPIIIYFKHQEAAMASLSVEPSVLSLSQLLILSPNQNYLIKKEPNGVLR